ncbi:MAG: Uma2 family endonuclease [Defluviitaleaceae bacterium]|nr:Uma2 family endonuclease [Defluviitaleaceae bacterium]
MSNLLKQDYEDFYEDYDREEIIDGQIVAMAPARAEHGVATANLIAILWNYFKGKPCRVYTDTIMVVSEKDKFAPDIMVACNPAIALNGDIISPPDLVVEVLSRSTTKLDRGYKKDAYEKHGVREYWIVDVGNKTVEVFHLRDGKYALDYIYMAESRRETITKIKVSNFDGLIIDVQDIFMNVI